MGLINYRVFGPPLVDEFGYQRVYVDAIPLRVQLLTRLPWLIAIRVWHVLLALVIVALAIAGWHYLPRRGPDGGVLATVDGAPITTLDVTAEAQSRGISPAGLTPQARTALLNAVIDRKLLAEAARKNGVERNPLFGAMQARAGEMVAANAVARQFVGSEQPVGDDEVQRFEAAHPFAFGQRATLTVDTVVATLNDAARKRVGSADTLQDVLDILSATGVPFTRAQRQFDTAALPADLATKLTGLPAGSVFAFPGAGQTIFGTVIARSPHVASPAEQAAMARSQINAMRSQDQLKAALAKLRQSVDVRTNPHAATS